MGVLDKNGDIIHTVDFRSIYATILDKWLAVDDEKILNKSFNKFNKLIFKKTKKKKRKESWMQASTLVR